ncbi:MAG: methylated-DNA--[protein]-cysteine S-methyltransferase [Anaerolineae bacterium]|nr:methylated-DNA--[protein]-cysteine S-methyltransferase [Anaerolineae bacterium]
MSTSNVRELEQSGTCDIVYAHTDSPVGPVWVAATDAGVCAVELGTNQPEALLDRLSHHIDVEPPREDPEALASALTQLREYFSRIRREFDLTLDIVYGTSFQRAVWKEIADIPYGTTATYGEIARRVEQPQAARAVGAALGANLLPILIPCHRVIGARDRLVGYRAGVETKAALLRLEGVLLS